jgi:LysM repeat protein
LTGAAMSSKSGAAAKKQSDQVYKVKSGETLWHIATKFRVSVDAIKRSNKLSSNGIKVGQRLRIPG